MSVRSAKILLAAVFIARGTSFLFSKELMKGMSPLGILAVRFLLAFFILAIAFFPKIKSCTKEALFGGIYLGVLYTACMIFEMYGLRLVDSGVSALVENMAILFVPLYAAVLTRSFPQKKTMICAFFAVVGVAFLSLSQKSAVGGGIGMVWTVCAALIYGVCIMATERVANRADPITVGIIQLGVMGLLTLAASLMTKSFGLPQTGRQWGYLLFLVLICSSFGFAFQPLGQKYLSAETAAVFTVMNPLTASLMGILVAGESVTPFKMVGYVLILAALFRYNYQGKIKE